MPASACFPSCHCFLKLTQALDDLLCTLSFCRSRQTCDGESPGVACLDSPNSNRSFSHRCCLFRLSNFVGRTTSTIFVLIHPSWVTVGTRMNTDTESFVLVLKTYRHHLLALLIFWNLSLPISGTETGDVIPTLWSILLVRSLLSGTWAIIRFLNS